MNISIKPIVLIILILGYLGTEIHIKYKNALARKS